MFSSLGLFSSERSMGPQSVGSHMPVSFLPEPPFLAQKSADPVARASFP
jgi:hypothetical protein